MEEQLRPRVVQAQQRVRQDALQTAGVLREQAFSTDDVWIGIVTTEPGAMSAWHHHGDHDTYAYVVSGLKRIEYGPGGTGSLVARPDDFIHLPKGVDAPRGESERRSLLLDRVQVGTWSRDDQRRRATVSGAPTTRRRSPRRISPSGLRREGPEPTDAVTLDAGEHGTTSSPTRTLRSPTRCGRRCSTSSCASDPRSTSGRSARLRS